MIIPSVCLEYPLRPDYLAQLVLPQDLTLREAQRLCEFIRTLVIDGSEANRGVKP